jgi:hypothetical protein
MNLLFILLFIFYLRWKFVVSERDFFFVMLHECIIFLGAKKRNPVGTKMGTGVLRKARISRVGHERQKKE